MKILRVIAIVAVVLGLVGLCINGTQRSAQYKNDSPYVNVE